MSFEFMPATRRRGRARIALAGPSGSGKSYTALTLASALVGAETIGDGRRRIAAIDTERETLSLYSADHTLPDVEAMPQGSAGGFGYSEICPVRFDPRELVEMVDAAADAGFPALLLDSATHYWNGPAGMLEKVDLATRRHNGRSLDAWKEVGAQYERPMIEALLGYPGHVIVTMRSKQAYALEEKTDSDGNRKTKASKLGLQPQQREGIEYEFDIVGDIDMEHWLHITKSRCSALDSAVIHKPGPELAHTILDWLERGDEPKFVDWSAELENTTSMTALNALWTQAERAGASRLLRAAFTARKTMLTSGAFVNGRRREEVSA